MGFAGACVYAKSNRNRISSSTLTLCGFRVSRDIGLSNPIRSGRDEILRNKFRRWENLKLTILIKISLESSSLAMSTSLIILDSNEIITKLSFFKRTNIIIEKQEDAKSFSILRANSGMTTKITSERLRFARCYCRKCLARRRGLKCP